MNGAYRARELSAFEVRAKTLVVDGQRFGASELAARCGCRRGSDSGAGAASESASRADQEAARELLVQTCRKHDLLLEEKLAQVEAALEQTRAAIDERKRLCAAGDVPVTIERTASKSGKFWYVAGRRVAANELRISDGTGRRYIAETNSVAQVLQKLADELDQLHAKFGEK